MIYNNIVFTLYININIEIYDITVPLFLMKSFAVTPISGVDRVFPDHWIRRLFLLDRVPLSSTTACILLISKDCSNSKDCSKLKNVKYKPNI